MKIMIFDQGNPVTGQLVSKAAEVFGSAGGNEIVIARSFDKDHEAVTEMLYRTISDERPEVLLIGSTVPGEEIAAALGVRLGSGVAAHCVDMTLSEEGEVVFMIPAFGGRAIGEIMVPDASAGKPAIATFKQDIFSDDGSGASRVIEMTGESSGGFRLTGVRDAGTAAADIGKAELILCGGAGIGGSENWDKLERIAKALGAACGCTRPVADADWGPGEDSMIGTSGRTVKPKVYVGFGISGAAHHLCGIKDAGIIISINKDRGADVFAASDYKGTFDAGKLLDALEKELDI